LLLPNSPTEKMNLDKYKELVKDIKPNRLFYVAPSWEMLKENKCPICGSNLKFSINKPLAYCRGKRHFKNEFFAISLEKLERAKAYG